MDTFSLILKFGILKKCLHFFVEWQLKQIVNPPARKEIMEDSYV